MNLHLAVAAIFLTFGVAFGLWAGASGTILAHAGVDAGAFGVALTAFMATYLFTMSASGRIAQRFGVARALAAATPSLGLAVAALLSAPSPAFVYAALLVAGVLGGLVDVLMNVEGARIERRLGRPILARLHACASAGGAAGAILGSLIATGGAPWLAPILALVPLGLAGAYFVGAARRDGPEPPPEAGASRRGLSFAPALVLLGAVIGVCIASENAAALWSSILLRAEAPGLAAISGLGAAFFSGCQASLRVNADGIRARFSDRRIIVVSLVAAAAGFAIVALQAGFAASVVGFALIGAGTGAVVPCGFALAARHPGVAPATGLASISLFSAAPRLPAPLATGALAEAFTLSRAFALFAVFLLLAALGMAILWQPAPARVPSLPS